MEVATIVELSMFPCVCVCVCASTSAVSLVPRPGYEANLRYNHAAGKRTVGVKVKPENTEVYVFP